MPKYKALVTMTLNCEVEIDAKDRDSAWEGVEDMEPVELLNHVVSEQVEIDDVTRVRAKKADQ